MDSSYYFIETKFTGEYLITCSGRQAYLLGRHIQSFWLSSLVSQAREELFPGSFLQSALMPNAPIFSNLNIMPLIIFGSFGCLPIISILFPEAARSRIWKACQMLISRIEVAMAAGVCGAESSRLGRIGTGRASFIVSSLFNPKNDDFRTKRIFYLLGQESEAPNVPD